MNTSIDAANPEQEYRKTMQQAALGFMQRHQAEYLGDDQLLFTRAVRHLQVVLEVPVYLAETLAGLAYGELRSHGEHRRLDLSCSSASVAVLNDPKSGLTYTVPVSLIFHHLIDTPNRRRLRAVN